MIDNISIKTPIDSPLINISQKRPEIFKVGKLELIGVNCSKSREIIKYELTFKNLYFSVKGDVLFIRNSLHKFCKGNNYSDFTHSELIESIRYIEYLTEISADNYLINKLEFGMNILPSFSPLQELESIGDFKGYCPAPMISRPTIYGKKFYLTQYALKLYDKKFQVYKMDGIKIKYELLRVEMEYGRRDKLPEGIVRLEDLKRPSALRLLLGELCKNIDRIRLTGNEDFSGLRGRDVELYFAGLNRQFWNNLEKGNINTFESRKKRFREIQNEVTPKDLIVEILEKLTLKFEQLLTS